MTWKKVSISYAAAKKRTPRDKPGTAYWFTTSDRHGLLVKLRDNKWRGTGDQKSLEACIAAIAGKPGDCYPSSDVLTANAITTNPKSKAVMQVGTVELATPKTKALSAKLDPIEQWRVLEQRGAGVVWRPITAKAIAAAEKALKFKFPLSYKAFVATGVPGLGKPGAKSFESLAWCVLTPPEVVKLTREIRKIFPELFEDPTEAMPRVTKELGNAVLFQIEQDAGGGYVYLVDTAKRGEMHVAMYHHDFVEYLDWYKGSKAIFTTPAAAMFHATKQIADDLP